MKNDTYAGRISNDAVQHVKALFTTSKNRNGKKTVGKTDLRCGKNSK